MLATTWYIFSNGGGQDVHIDGAHLLVYWIAPILGGCAAAVLYVIYKNGEGHNDTFMGWSVPAKVNVQEARSKRVKKVKNSFPFVQFPSKVIVECSRVECSRVACRQHCEQRIIAISRCTSTSSNNSYRADSADQQQYGCGQQR